MLTLGMSVLSWMYTLFSDVCVVVVPTLVYAIGMYTCSARINNQYMIITQLVRSANSLMFSRHGFALHKVFPVWNIPDYDVSVINWH